MQIATDAAARDTLFILAAAPGDERTLFGPLIAEACRRGRPPFLAVLTDGPDPAVTERQVRHAAAALGVPGDWLRMLGLPHGTAAPGGVVFDAVAAAVVYLMWRYDCTLVVTADDPVCTAVAAEVAARSGVGVARQGAVAGQRG